MLTYGTIQANHHVLNIWGLVAYLFHVFNTTHLLFYITPILPFNLILQCLYYAKYVSCYDDLNDMLPPILWHTLISRPSVFLYTNVLEQIFQSKIMKNVLKLSNLLPTQNHSTSDRIPKHFLNELSIKILTRQIIILKFTKLDKLYNGGDRKNWYFCQSSLISAHYILFKSEWNKFATTQNWLLWIILHNSRSKLDLHIWIFAPITRKYRQLSRKFEKVEFQRQSEFYKIHVLISINSIQTLFLSSSYLHYSPLQITWSFELNATMHVKDINVFITPTPKIMAQLQFSLNLAHFCSAFCLEAHPLFKLL